MRGLEVVDLNNGQGLKTILNILHNATKRSTASMSIYIYRPYFYIIQHIKSGKFYAGVKYAGNANPVQLLKSNGYHTSSSYIKNIILNEGLESFVIRKIKVFESGEEALDYESRFLRRVGASFNNNFLNRCNNSISTLNVDWEKRKHTCLDRYGVEHSFQSEEIKEKIKHANLEKFGFEYPSQSPEIQIKMKQTCLEKYGVENPFQSPETQAKMKQVNLEKLGFEYPSQSQKTQAKMKQTCLEKYGVENPFQSPEIQAKMKWVNLEKYGVENPSQCEEIKEKKKQTCLENFGVEYPGQSKLLREKIKKSCLEKYGVENPFQLEEVKEKISQTRKSLFNRSIVFEIKKYRDKFKLKLGNNWFWKKQEVLDIMLEELKMTYGGLE